MINAWNLISFNCGACEIRILANLICLPDAFTNMLIVVIALVNQELYHRG